MTQSEKIQKVLDDARKRGFYTMEEAMKDAVQRKNKEESNLIFNGVMDAYQDGIIDFDRYINFLNKYKYFDKNW